MKHENIYHTCDRCGKKISDEIHRARRAHFFRREVIPIKLKAITYEPFSYDSEKKIIEINEDSKILEMQIITSYNEKVTELELCKDCRKDFERFMKNERE